eukprot:2147341-Amphidinium_carterae.1
MRRDKQCDTFRAQLNALETQLPHHLANYHKEGVLVGDMHLPKMGPYRKHKHEFPTNAALSTLENKSCKALFQSHPQT